MTAEDIPMVFVIDDDGLVRASVQGLLKSAGLRSEAFETAEKFLRAKRPDGPSCLVLDVSLPGISGLDFQHELAEAGVQIPIIFITGHGDIPTSVKAMKSGAVEFLTKPIRGQDLVDAVQQALARAETTSRERNDIAALQERYGTLTAREREVMGLIVSSMQTKNVASMLGMSEITVAVHRGRVMRKMRAASPVELGRMAEKLNLPSIK